MQINLVQSYGFYSKNQKVPVFGRALREEEKAECEKACNDARELLGIKNLSLILHGSSFPADERDFYIGSFFNKKANDVYNFIHTFGFNSDQLGPNGLISKRDVSPYGGRAFSHNYLFVDLNKLAMPEYANILSEENLEVYKNKTDLGDMTNYVKAFAVYDNLLYNALRKLKYKHHAGEENAVKLMEEFTDYQASAGKWLKSDALYDVLRKRIYNGVPIADWSDLDRNLNVYLNDLDSPAHNNAVERKEELERVFKPDIELYYFKQFLYDKQLNEFLAENDGKVSFIGDALVGFSASDVWSNPDAFLEGYALGCPNGGANDSNQLWAIPVLDPKKLFNKDGSLGSAGRLLKEKFEHILGNAKTVRIDHAIGLVDPWYYKVDSVYQRDGGNYSDGNNISNRPELDPDKNYSKVLEKIILPLLKENGIDKDDVVWEDVGSQTQTFRDIYYGINGLAGIKNFRYAYAEQLEKESKHGYKIEPSRHWWNTGTHDNRAFLSELNDLNFVPPEGNYGQPKNKGFDPKYLAGFLYPNWTDEQRAPIVRDLETKPRERLKYKIVEMLAKGKNLQISFMDFFGLDKNKVYNRMGQNHPDNWRLRLSPKFDKDYYNTLENYDENKMALNMPELFAAALRSKLSWGLDKEPDKLEKAEAVLEKLDHYKNVLYEKSADDK